MSAIDWTVLTRVERPMAERMAAVLVRQPRKGPQMHLFVPGEVAAKVCDPDTAGFEVYRGGAGDWRGWLLLRPGRGGAAFATTRFGREGSRKTYRLVVPGDIDWLPDLEIPRTAVHHRVVDGALGLRMPDWFEAGA